MLLRRVTEHVKAQNWFAVGIDFVIVVVGVFIGIQVSNWNEDREMQRKAVVFTERLTDDLRKEAWGYESVVAYSRQTNASQRRVLQALAGDIELSEEQFLIDAYRATQFRENNRYRATFDELVSTGAIGLITDPVLREAAVGLFTTGFMEEFAQRVRDSEYRQLFRETVPAPVQEALLSRCGDRYPAELDYASLDTTIDYPCSLELPGEHISAAADALRAAPRFRPALQVRFADNQTALTDLQDSNPIVLESLRAIRERKP
tara:strand:- start:7613 stop:8395 length:783 start_codon:yes stop_codon:yes gene_type:complete